MGEFLVEAAPAIENKMGEPDARLGVSVSFGRFGNDTLSWEKWSYFSQNKYLEEAGNLSTPGLVAQKKAYFEAHYKKIAAQKAMELEQEKAVEHAGRSSEEPVVEGVLGSSSGIDDRSVTCDGEVSAEEIRRETCGTFSTNVVIDDEVKDDDPGSIREAKQGACADHLIDAADLGEEKEGALLDIKEEVLSGNGVVPGSNAGEEVTLVEAEAPPNNLPMIGKRPQENEESREQPNVMEKESSKSNARDIARKATATKRTTDRIASVVVRTPQASTPRNSRPISVDLTKSDPLFSKKKTNESALPEIKNTQVGECRSMIMGDNDTVKPALKTSQNRCKGPSSSGKCGSLKKAPSKTFEPKISTFPTPRNENKGLSLPEYMVSRVYTRLQKSPAPDRKNEIGVSPFSRSDERADKRKEFLKNLKASSMTRESENAIRCAKSKEASESEIKKLRQCHNFKATPLPSFYWTGGKSHSHPQKEGVVDNKIRHRPQPCVK